MITVDITIRHQYDPTLDQLVPIQYQTNINADLSMGTFLHIDRQTGEGDYGLAEDIARAFIRHDLIGFGLPGLVVSKGRKEG